MPIANITTQQHLYNLWKSTVGLPTCVVLRLPMFKPDLLLLAIRSGLSLHLLDSNVILLKKCQIDLVKSKFKLACSSLAVVFYKGGRGQRFQREGPHMN